MKNIVLFPLLLSLLVVLFACKKEVIVTGTASPLVSLNDVRALYKGTPKVLTMEDMLGASYISGIVISDPVNGNAPEGLVILQSFKRNLLRGIALNMGTEATNYNPGDSVVVKIDGKTLDRINGVLQISGVTADDVTRVSVGNPQHINLTTTTFTAITRWMETFESTLVSLKSIISQDVEVGDVFSGTVTLSDWSNVIRLVTHPTASFANEAVPGFGDYTGIMLKNNSEDPVLMLRNSDDYEVQALEPYHPQELYFGFPESWETPIGPRKGGYTTGQFENYDSGEWRMTRCYTLSSNGISHKTGSIALMMQASQIAVLEMNFNLPYGASKFSFDYGPATASDTNYPLTLKVEYSQDSGDTWTQIGSDLPITAFQKHTFEEDLDISGPVRFRISKDASGSRVFIDNIAVYQN